MSRIMIPVQTSPLLSPLPVLQLGRHFRGQSSFILSITSTRKVLDDYIVISCFIVHCMKFGTGF